MFQLRFPPTIAGICAKGGYEYAVSVYHYVMTLAEAAQSETLQYCQDNSTSETAFDRASWHLQQLEVCCSSAVEARSKCMPLSYHRSLVPRTCAVLSHSMPWRLLC